MLSVISNFFPKIYFASLRISAIFQFYCMTLNCIWNFLGRAVCLAQRSDKEL